jgi:hypothetical protein
MEVLIGHQGSLVPRFPHYKRIGSHQGISFYKYIEYHPNLYLIISAYSLTFGMQEFQTVTGWYLEEAHYINSKT